MTAKEVLEKAKELLLTNNWTQRAWARNKNFIQVNIEDPQAVCFCLEAAIFRVGFNSHDPHDMALYQAYDKVREFLGGMTIASFNDMSSQTKEGVIALLDKAIAAC